MSGQPFHRVGSVVLDAAGAGDVVINVTGGDWVITRSTVSVSSNTKEPTASTYRGLVSPANLIDSSYTGSNDSSDTRITLQQADFITCRWTGGDAGARATLNVAGVQYPPGQAPLE